MFFLNFLFNFSFKFSFSFLSMLIEFDCFIVNWFLAFRILLLLKIAFFKKFISCCNFSIVCYWWELSVFFVIIFFIGDICWYLIVFLDILLVDKNLFFIFFKFIDFYSIFLDLLINLLLVRIFFLSYFLTFLIIFLILFFY